MDALFTQMVSCLSFWEIVTMKSQLQDLWIFNLYRHAPKMAPISVNDTRL